MRSHTARLCTGFGVNRSLGLRRLLTDLKAEGGQLTSVVAAMRQILCERGTECIHCVSTIVHSAHHADSFLYHIQGLALPMV